MTLSRFPAVRSVDKPVNRMDRLADMAHFPAVVNAGATINVLLTLGVTWWLQPRFPEVWAPVAWVAVVLCVNLLPVAVLRLGLNSETVYPPLGRMNFWRDQHKFSDWVYVAASANMAFWVLSGWALFSVARGLPVLLLVLAVALLVTFSPVILRGFRRGSAAGER